MSYTLSGEAPPAPDFNLSAAIQHELSISGGHAEPEEIAARVVRNIPDGCLRAVVAHELMPRAVVDEAERLHARHAVDEITHGRGPR
jgi:hypothetical protein